MLIYLAHRLLLQVLPRPRMLITSRGHLYLVKSYARAALMSIPADDIELFRYEDTDSPIAIGSNAEIKRSGLMDERCVRATFCGSDRLLLAEA